MWILESFGFWLKLDCSNMYNISNKLIVQIKLDTFPFIPGSIHPSISFISIPVKVVCGRIIKVDLLKDQCKDKFWTLAVVLNLVNSFTSFSLLHTGIIQNKKIIKWRIWRIVEELV